MNTIFYNHILGTEKLATVMTEKTPEELIEEDVIPRGAAYLVQPDPYKGMPEEEYIKYLEIDYTYFDDYKNPTQVIVDYSAIMASLIDEMREYRNELLVILDSLQQRSLVKKLDEIVDEIETDKQALRDCLNIDVTKYKCANDLKDYAPDIFFIDYKLKFERKINA